jgi:hypothetical protein
MSSAVDFELKERFARSKSKTRRSVVPALARERGTFADTAFGSLNSETLQPLLFPYSSSFRHKHLMDKLESEFIFRPAVFNGGYSAV